MTAIRDSLGDRMKNYYESIPKTRLVRRMPVILRLDGKAFHTFTRGFKKPFDNIFMTSMIATMKYLCENIQGCVFGYTQSDEITLVLIDYQELNTSAWFDYEIQKMCSIGASMCTMYFNKEFSTHIMVEKAINDDIDHIYAQRLDFAAEKGAMFDCRCFNIPKEEVCNCILWRQLDATRNSIQMVGQANFSHKELHGKSCNMIQDMLHEQKGINWNDFPIYQKRGTACYKILENGKRIWIIDKNMPILKNEDRNYVEKHILI